MPYLCGMFRILIAWVWLFHIVATTVGVNVHRIYCACTGEIAISLRKDHQDHCPDSTVSDCCAPKAEPLSCCAKELIEPPASCCETKSVSVHDGLCAETKDCMQDEVIVLQLDSDLQTTSLEKNTLTAAISLESLLPCVFMYPDKPSARKALAPNAFRGPPLLPYGKLLLPFTQTWLC
jgi:hypothetical protein